MDVCQSGMATVFKVEVHCGGDTVCGHYRVKFFGVVLPAGNNCSGVVGKSS